MCTLSLTDPKNRPYQPLSGLVVLLGTVFLLSDCEKAQRRPGSRSYTDWYLPRSGYRRASHVY